MSKRLNIVGNVYGNLTVLSTAGTDNRHQSLWLCACTCGNRITVHGRNLQNCNTRSCGCLQRQTASNDLMGQRFGRLIVIGSLPIRQYGNIKWICLCDCGNVTYVQGTSLLHGRTQSCTCLQKETTVQSRSFILNGGTSKSATLFLNTMETLLNASITREYYLDGYYYDGRLGRLLIEVDGTYWHRNTKLNDARKDVVALKHGFVILRVPLDDKRKSIQTAREYKANFEKALTLHHIP